MAYKSEKLRKKVKPITLIIIGVIIAIIVGFVLIMQPSKTQKINKQFVGIDLDKNHVIEEITYKKLLKRINNDESIIVFFGSPENEASRTEIALYNEEFFTQGVDEHFKKIYYVNVTKVKEDQKTDFNELFKINMDNQGNLVFFKNGEMITEKNDTTKFPVGNDTKAIKIIKDFYLEVIKQNKAQ